MKEAGAHVFFLEPAPYWEPAEEVMVTHYAKVIVNSCNARLPTDSDMGWENWEGWDTLVGFPVEIEPLVQCTSLWTGSAFTGIVRVNGKPAPRCRVEVEYLNERGELKLPDNSLSHPNPEDQRPRGVHFCAAARGLVGAYRDSRNQANRPQSGRQESQSRTRRRVVDSLRGHAMKSAEPTTMTEDHDANELQQFGYQQQLRRSMGSFSSFAVAFSLISVFTGVFANFGHGLRQVGGALVWSWLAVLAGQMLVALLLAELSTRFPLSGYGYQWTSRLVNPHFGFFVGWLLTLQFLTGFPGVCATLAAPGRQLAGRTLGRTIRRDGAHARRDCGDRPRASLRHSAGLARQQRRRLD